ncbi:MAG: phosphate acyltransferase PlsX [Chloroflexi bacterium]|nr:phosphate acyltransferase PlsX [Chloroflexota bacterium]
MRIAIDAMGGDFAPAEIVKGSVAGARDYGVDIILVGPQDLIKKELSKNGGAGDRISIVHTDEYLLEGEHPAYTLRKKRNASILVATKLVKEGKADAVIGVGPTGGVVASALQVLGTIEGVSRPVVGGPFLGFAPNTMVMDLGGNVDCKPEMLLDFAVVGTVFARKMMNIPNPTVALLSIGAEEGKGNEAVNSAHALLKKSGLNFIGNVEGYDLPLGKANIIVCDGFVGNIVVKYTENLGKVLCKWLEERLKNKISDTELKKMVNDLLVATNISDVRGGGPLLAVNGISCVGHGRSMWQDVAHTIEQAKTAYERDLVGAMKAEFAAVRAKLASSAA